MDTRSHLCPWCGNENARDSVLCSSCGTPLGHDEPVHHRRRPEGPRKPVWRRRWLQIALAVVVVVAAGVVAGVTVLGGDEALTSQSTVTQAAAGSTDTTLLPATTDTSLDEPPPAPSTAKFGETIEFWDTTMTVSSPEILTDAGLETLVGDDIDVYAVLVTIENTGSESRDYNLFYWQAADEDGSVYDASLYIESQALDTGDIQPGETAKGYVGFELPKGKSVTWVSYSPMLAGDTATWER